jgi:hypothetical protein
MGQQQAQTNNNVIPNRTRYNISEEKESYILLQWGGPLPSTAGVKSLNTIWKSKPKENLVTNFAQLLESKDYFHITTHINRGLSFVNKGGRGNHVVHGIMG